MSDFSHTNDEVKLKHVPKWLCNYGTGHTHCSHYIRRQTSENVYCPVSHYLCEACEGPFSRGAHIYTLRVAITLCWRRLYISHIYTPLCKKWCLCTWRLAYILHESWLPGVFCVYTTLKLGLRKFAWFTMINILHIYYNIITPPAQVVMGNDHHMCKWSIAPMAERKIITSASCNGRNHHVHKWSIYVKSQSTCTPRCFSMCCGLQNAEMVSSRLWYWRLAHRLATFVWAR